MSEGRHASQSPSSIGASSPIWYEIMSMKVKSPSRCTKHLNRQDWEMFVETATSEAFLEKREHLKNLRGRIMDNHRLDSEDYAGKEKGKWRKEDAAME